MRCSSPSPRPRPAKGRKSNVLSQIALMIARPCWLFLFLRSRVKIRMGVSRPLFGQGKVRTAVLPWLWVCPAEPGAAVASVPKRAKEDQAKAIQEVCKGFCGQ